MAQGGVPDLRLPLQRRPPLKSPHPSVLGCSACFPLLSTSDCSQLCLPAAVPDSLILCVVCVSVTQGAVDGPGALAPPPWNGALSSLLWWRLAIESQGRRGLRFQQPRPSSGFVKSTSAGHSCVLAFQRNTTFD